MNKSAACSGLSEGRRLFIFVELTADNVLPAFLHRSLSHFHFHGGQPYWQNNHLSRIFHSTTASSHVGESEIFLTP